MRSISSFASAALGTMVLLWALAPGVVEAQRSAATLYKDAQASEKKLHQSKARLKKKSEWNNVAKAYRKVVLAHPQSGYSDDALYYEGEILLEIHRRFEDRAALQRSLDTYLLLANGYPSSKWAKRARLTRGKIFLERSERKNASIELRKVTSQWPNTSEGLRGEAAAREPVAAETRRERKLATRSHRRPEHPALVRLETRVHSRRHRFGQGCQVPPGEAREPGPYLFRSSRHARHQSARVEAVSPSTAVS